MVLIRLVEQLSNPICKYLCSFFSVDIFVTFKGQCRNLAKLAIPIMIYDVRVL